MPQKDKVRQSLITKCYQGNQNVLHPTHLLFQQLGRIQSTQRITSTQIRRHTLTNDTLPVNGKQFTLYPIHITRCSNGTEHTTHTRHYTQNMADYKPITLTHTLHVTDHMLHISAGDDIQKFCSRRFSCWRVPFQQSHS